MKLKVFLAAVMMMTAATAAHAATDLVVNGDFSQGNTGFTSGYTYVAPSPHAMMPETVYTIAADPHAVHPYWVNLHDNKPLLLVNGATTSGVTVWQESLATVAGQSYAFSASATDVCCNQEHPGKYAPSELEFEISSNGFATFQTLGAINTAPPGDAGDFQTVTASFKATGPLEIRVIDALTGRVGNDFAISDISVTALANTGGDEGGSDTTGGGPTGGGETTAPVPEPASWTLMIIGFGAVGAALRAPRRRGAIA